MEPRKSSVGYLIRQTWPLVLLLIVALAIAFNPFSSTREEPQEREPAFGIEERRIAWLDCRQAMKEKLKAPASAKFPLDPASWAWKAEGKNAWVEGYVDAQNTFGAFLRTRFACEFGWTGRGWALTSLAYQ